VDRRGGKNSQVRASGWYGREGGHVTAGAEGECARVLEEGDGVELLAYLVTAARTQVDEAAEYAPMRLLTAAARLAEMAEPNASAGLRPLLRAIWQGCSETAVQAGDPAGYAERLDGLCQVVADYLVRWLGLDTAP
jgi:hypothetical protein